MFITCSLLLVHSLIMATTKVETKTDSSVEKVNPLSVEVSMIKQKAIAGRAKDTLAMIIPELGTGTSVSVTLTSDQVARSKAALEWFANQFSNQQDQILMLSKTVEHNAEAGKAFAEAAKTNATNVAKSADLQGQLFKTNLTLTESKSTLELSKAELLTENNALKEELGKLKCPWGTNCTRKSNSTHGYLKHDHAPFGPGKPRDTAARF